MDSILDPKKGSKAPPKIDLNLPKPPYGPSTGGPRRPIAPPPPQIGKSSSDNM